jgi:hypothetical protein
VKRGPLSRECAEDVEGVVMVGYEMSVEEYEEDGEKVCKREWN